MSSAVNCKSRLPAPKEFIADKDVPWFVFPGSTIEPLKEPMDCTSTVNGVCERGKSLGECINICNASDDCSSGYFVVADQNRDKSLCVPLSLSSRFPDIETLNYVRNKSCFPSTDNTQVNTAFFKKGLDESGKRSFLPDNAASIFNGDFLAVEGYNGGGIQKGEIGVAPVLGTSFGTLQIRALHDFNMRIRYGDIVALVFKGDADEKELILSLQNGVLTWKIHRGEIDTDFQMFQLLPLSIEDHQVITRDPSGVELREPRKWNTPQSVITYGSPFAIAVASGLEFFTESRNGRLDVSSTKPGAVGVSVKPTMIFRCLPRGKGYVCEKDRCVSVPLLDCSIDQDRFRFQGKTVFRESNCYSSCAWGKETEEPIKELEFPDVLSHCTALESEISIQDKFRKAARSVMLCDSRLDVRMLLFFLSLVMLLIFSLLMRMNTTSWKV